VCGPPAARVLFRRVETFATDGLVFGGAENVDAPRGMVLLRERRTERMKSARRAFYGGNSPGISFASAMTAPFFQRASSLLRQAFSMSLVARTADRLAAKYLSANQRAALRRLWNTPSRLKATRSLASRKLQPDSKGIVLTLAGVLPVDKKAVVIGGKVKLRLLRDAFSQSESTFNILYLVSSAFLLMRWRWCDGRGDMAPSLYGIKTA